MLAIIAFLALAFMAFGCTRIAKSTEEPSFCEGNDNDTERDICYFDLAKQTNDSSACADITNASFKEECANATKKA